MTADRQLLKHFLAGLAYRTQKAVRHARPEYANFGGGAGVRTPWQILHHMTGVLSYALSRFEEIDPRFPPCETFTAEVERFHRVLEQLGRHLDRGTAMKDSSVEQLLQGPFSDAMSHAGQLAMLRRLSGDPIPPENFHSAAISSSNLSESQQPPVDPDREWTDAEGQPQK